MDQNEIDIPDFEFARKSICAALASVKSVGSENGRGPGGREIGNAINNLNIALEWIYRAEKECTRGNATK